MLKNALILIAKVAVSAGVLVWLLSGMDLAVAWGWARTLNPWAGIAAFSLMIGQALLGGWRWSLVARACGGDLPYWPSLRFQMIGLFFNMVMPGMVGGDVVRGIKARRAGLTAVQAIDSVLLERLLTLAALIFLVTALQGFLADAPTPWLFPALSVGCVVVGVALMNLARLPRAVLPGVLRQGAEALTRDARALLLMPRYLAGGLGLAVLGQAMLALSVGALGQGMGIDIGLLDSLILVPPAILAMVLPISIAGWGVREGVMVALLGTIGVAPEAAFALSVLFGVFNNIGLGLVGAAFWIAERDNSQTSFDAPASRAAQDEEK